MLGCHIGFNQLMMYLSFWAVLVEATLLHACDNLPQPSGSVLFCEPFEDATSIQDNGGRFGHNGPPDFVDGMFGNGASFTGSRSVCYPLTNNFNRNAGTIEFWVKPPSKNHVGFVDIGTLGQPNSWGIFKDRDHVIMEVKNSLNHYDQAWSPAPIDYNGMWHFVAAAWVREGETTLFKVCWDGNCKASYDGLTMDSFPDLSGEICIGWSGWYGYAESAFDELQIYDHARSDAEIEAAFRNAAPVCR